MTPGLFQVQVIVNKFVIPFYQYTSYGAAKISVSSSYTPQLTSIDQNKALPGTLLSLSGNFMTSCLTRDTASCSGLGIPLISRVDFGSQTCDMINASTTNL